MARKNYDLEKQSKIEIPNPEEWHIRISNYDKEPKYIIEVYDKNMEELCMNIGMIELSTKWDGKLFEMNNKQFLVFAQNVCGTYKSRKKRNISEETRNKMRENAARARAKKG